MEYGTEKLYVERAECAICHRPTVRVGLESVDDARGKKEPVVCGDCLEKMPETAAKGAVQEIERQKRRDDIAGNSAWR